MPVLNRSGSWLLIVATSLALSSCWTKDSSSPEDTTSIDGQRFEWKRIESDGTFRSIEAIDSSQPPPHVTAAGVKDGKPLVVYIVEGKATEIPFRDGGARGAGLRTLTDDGMNYSVTDVTNPSSGQPAHIWHGYSDPPDPDIISPTTEGAPLYSNAGLRPVWLDPLSTSEDFGVIGVVREKDRWRVHGWLAYEKLAQLDERSPLYLRMAPSSERLLTGITEDSMIAAGDLTESGTDTSHSPQVWTLDLDYGLEPSSRWEDHPLDPVPDGLTEIATWDSGWQLAGHKDLAPVVYDFDEGTGEAIDVPPTRLDPDHPGVFVALNIGSPILATQSVGGPKVWIKIEGRWRDIAAPEGRLHGIGFAGDELYLLVDGSIWRTQAPAALLRTRD